VLPLSLQSYLIPANFAMIIFYQVLKSSRVSEPEKKNLKNNSHGKASKRVSSEESADSSDKESDEEEEVKPKKKKTGAEQKMQNAEGSKKRGRLVKETKVSAKKRIKPSETVSEDNNDMEDSGNVSEDNDSPSSAEKPLKVSLPTPTHLLQEKKTKKRTFV